MDPYRTTERGKNSSMDVSLLTFKAMIGDHRDILTELMSVTSSQFFLELFLQLPKLDSVDYRHYYRVRIEGVMAAFDGFIAFVNEALNPTCTNWSAMIWGSAIFVLKLSSTTALGREKSLAWLEKLSNMIALPRLGKNMSVDRAELQLVTTIIQLFTDLACSLLSIVIFLRTQPHIFGDSSQRYEPLKSEILKIDRLCEGASARLSTQADWISKFMIPSPSLNSISSTLQGKLPYRDISFARDKYFFGREDYLQKIHRFLPSGNESLTTVSIHGLPGVGKTQLAAEYVHRFGSKFQVIIWITADDRVKVSDGLANAASDLALGGCNAVTDSTIATKAIQSWLKQTDEPWLLVFDNVDDMALLRDFWPLRSRGNVILTSRDPFTSFESQITHSIRLEPLSKEQSFELFCKITRHDINTKCPPQLDHFLDDWGGLPIALAQIGGFVRENGLTWQDFIGLYAENAPLLHAHRLETWQYEHSIATAFSIDRLDITAKGILWALTFLDPEKIPNELLMLAFEDGVSFITLRNKFEYITSLAKLQKTSLLRKDGDDITVHRLVQAVVWDSMTDHQRKSCFDAVLRLLVQNFPKETNGRPMWQSWTRCERLLPHVLFLWRRFRAEFPEGHKCAGLAELLGSCTWFLFERGHFSQVAELVETLQTTCLEEQKSILAKSFFIRAGLCADNNRVKEADLLIKQCVDLREQILSPSDPDLGNTYYSAAIISMECDRHDESLEYHKKAIAVRNACGDDDHTQTAVAFQNLALLYLKTRELDAAESYLEKALNLCRTSSGLDSDRYAEVLFDTGNLRYAQCRIADALKVHRDALRIREKIIPTHFKTGFSLHKVGLILFKCGRLREAKQYVERALCIFEHTWDAAPKLARSNFLLGEILYKMGEHEEAVKAHIEATRLRDSVTTFPILRTETMEAYELLISSWFR